MRLWDPAPTQRSRSSAQQERFPSTSSSTSTSTATRSAGRASRRWSRLRELDSGSIPDSTWTNQHLVYTHGYGAVAAAANQVDGDEPSLPALRHPADRRAAELDPKQPGRLLRREPLAGTRSSTPRSRSNRPRPARHDRGDAATRATAGVKVSSFLRKSRARAAVRRLEPLRLGPAHDELAGPLHARHQASGCRPPRRSCKFDADPYPVVVERPHPVGARRVHDDEPLPVLAVDPPEQPPDGQRSRHRLQLRAQLGEGHRRRLRRHDQLLRRRRCRRPDHPERTRRRSPSCSATPGQDAGRAASEHWRYPEDCSTRRPSSSRCTT